MPDHGIDKQLQKQQFLAGEGDQWFARNRTHLGTASPVRDRIIERVSTQLAGQVKPRVLEVGCSHGDNLAELARRMAIDGHGIDPSAQAVEQGRTRWPQIALRQGTADDLPYEGAFFDLVWFGFCLYLVDRALLMRCVAEADRVLRDGGLLAIVDFDPAVPTARRYHHREGLWSYKMDYTKLFLANPAYVLVDKHATSHTSGAWEADPHERVALTLCRKDLTHAYVAS